MVRCARTLAGRPVHPDRPYPLGNRGAGKGEIDAHALVLGEHQRPVVPVGEDLFVRPPCARDVHQAEVGQSSQGLAFGVGDVGGVDEVGRVPHVGVGGSDVEITAGEYRRGRQGLFQACPQRGEPRDLVGVVRIVHRPPVGHIKRPDPDAATRRGQCPRFWLREAGTIGEPAFDVAQADPGEDRYPVPPAVSVMCDGVAAAEEIFIEELEEGVVGELGLLEADHVRLDSVQPFDQTRLPCLRRVDVPCRYPHHPTLASILAQLSGTPAGSVGASGWSPWCAAAGTTTP